MGRYAEHVNQNRSPVTGSDSFLIFIRPYLAGFFAAAGFLAGAVFLAGAAFLGAAGLAAVGFFLGAAASFTPAVLAALANFALRRAAVFLFS